MIVIFEGIDKSGKSTVLQDLVGRIRSDHVWPIVYKLENKPRDNSEFERNKVWIAYSELFAQAVRQSPMQTVIFDRAYPSELVHSPRRGYDAFYLPRWWGLDESLRDIAKIVYCSAPLDVIKERFVLTNEKDPSDDLEEIIERYEMFLERTSLPVLRVDTTQSRVTNLDKIDEYLRS